MKHLTSRRSGLVAALAVAVVLGGGLASHAVVSAAEATISVGSLNTGVGLQGTVDLEALDVGAPGLGAWTIDIVYDPEVANVVECAAEHGGICNPSYAENAVRITGMSAFGVEGDATLGTVAFACKRVGATDLTLTLSVLADATPGDPQPLDAATRNGRITCKEEVEATPTPTPTDDPTELPGDANCDETVNAVDAAFVLQFDAGLIDSVPCPDDADVNEDGVINPIDAALILQDDAGLI